MAVQNNQHFVLCIRESFGMLMMQKNRSRMNRIFFLLALCVLLIVACSEPSPLFGTWADNKGNTFSFFDDYSFNARVATGLNDSPALNYSGNYSLLLNVLTMDCVELDMRVVNEWDIRGNVLYLNWVNPNSETVFLTLFKIAN
jgi:hypothetical protein